MSFSTPDEGHLSQAPLVGRMIDSPSSELEIRYPAPIGFQQSDSITTPMNPVNAFPQATWLQLLEQSRVDCPSDPSQTALSRHQTSNSNLIIATLVGRPDIAAFRDTVCSYLRLTSGLWTELYKPREYTTAHRLLTRYLSQQYGRLPPDLWRLINELRDQFDFEQSRYECIDIISSIPTPPNMFTHGLALSGGDGPDLRGPHGWATPRSLEASSSRAAQMPSPGPGPDSQTRPTTPVSVANGRRRLQSPPHQEARDKGRAPRGKRYKCPYMNCRHDAFRNAGNFTNHMRRLHAESEYGNRPPADFLVPDSSPQPSNQGDTTSSVITNVSDSPLTRRRLSDESAASEDGMTTAGDDRVRDIGDIAFTAEQDKFHIGMGQGVFDQGSPEVPVTSRLESSSLLEAFRFVPTNYSALQMSQCDRKQGSHYPPQDEVRYGQFQIMEEQAWQMRTG
ncbi:hypothetical protein AYO22_11837 [Fonsecaea multimorphosa]|nr:hypothetical protein AYO22_11837 [Fonsecaea multimorphosa]